jgi:hypothetical protein
MKATLHIGTEKTGTKTLQEFFHRNRRRLLDQGILYTRSLGLRNNHQLALLGYPVSRRDDITIRAGIGSDDSMLARKQELSQLLADELEAHRCRHVLFSSEHLQSRLRNFEEIEQLHRGLTEIGFQEIEVIVYLRNPVSICRSLYASSVATGSTARQPPPPDNPYFSRICDHRRTLKTWSDVFGPEAIRPHLFERKTMMNGSIIDAFCQAAGIDIADGFERPKNRNESLSKFAVELLTRINSEIPRIREGKLDKERKKLVELVRRHCPGPSYSPPDAVLEQYRDYFADSNEWVRRHYFPKRDTLFSESLFAPPEPVAASDAELDVMADLVVALWRSVGSDDRAIAGGSVHE